MKKIFIKNSFSFILWILFLLSNQTLFSQIDSSLVASISLKDGSELKGFIIMETDSTIDFHTISGIDMKINRILVKNISFSKGEIINDQFQRYDPNRTRLFFSPTARTIEQGKGYFSAYEIFIPFLAVGLTDFLTFSGGVSLIPGATEQLIYIGPKVRVLNLENFSLSGGMIYAHINEENFGIVYGVSTLGSARDAFTFGIGWGYTDENFSDSPFITLGGEIQLSNSVKLLSENWIIPDSPVIISFGIRFFGDNLAADFGSFRPVGEDTDMEGWPFIPWIGFAYNW